MSYALRSFSRSRWSPACGGLRGGGGMGLFPGASMSGSACMLAASGPDREGAGLGCAAGGGLVPEFLFSLLVDVASLG